MDTYHSKTIKTLQNATCCWLPKEFFFLLFTDGLNIFVKITSTILCGITGTLSQKFFLSPKILQEINFKKEFVVISEEIGTKSTSKTQIGLQIKQKIAQNEFWRPGLVLGLRSRELILPLWSCE